MSLALSFSELYLHGENFKEINCQKLEIQAEFFSNKQTECNHNNLGQDGLVSSLHVTEKPNH